jgi:hypothetical protein
MVGVGSSRLPKVFTMPRLSAMNTRPSAAKSIAVGSTRPDTTIDSWKPAAVTIEAGAVVNVQVLSEIMELPARS